MEDQAEYDLLKQMPGLLLPWYDRHSRVLPWRENQDPYRIWVSEIMLQQTRVEAVKPYFERFLAALPTLQALGAAPEEELLKLWEGLGYYNRVRNLQKGAREVLERFQGRVPDSVEELRTLPGIGDYTAGAIASIAYDKPVCAVDGNVLRVLSRLLCDRRDITEPSAKRSAREKLEAVIPKRAGDFNQALMELGAVVCLPNGEPRCEDCPLLKLCEGRKQGVERELPHKAPKKPRKKEEKTVLLLFRENRLALRKRPPKGLLAGLFEPPSLPGTLKKEEAENVLKDWGFSFGPLLKLPAAKHIFTHVQWEMTGFLTEVKGKGIGELVWVSWEELQKEYALPSAFKAYVPEIEAHLKPKEKQGEKDLRPV